jgi:hypothetical protein
MQKFGISESYGNGLGVSIETMGIMSYQRAYRIVKQKTSREIFPNGTVYTKKANRPVTYPLMMAVINVDHGKVTVCVNMT